VRGDAARQVGTQLFGCNAHPASLRSSGDELAFRDAMNLEDFAGVKWIDRSGR
jgi:hypothetical protein